MNFQEVQQYLLDKECVTTEFDDKSFTVLEYGTFENKLENAGIKEDTIPTEDKIVIANTLQNKYKFASIKVSENYYIDFDFTLLKEDVNCNLNYILNAIHSFHDTFQREINKYIARTEYLATQTNV